tara:strand:- start:411 stop:611 length:201 start_codon:yes stop_codon:yes gene_type:complete
MKFKRGEKCYWDCAANNGWLIYLGVERGWHQFALANDSSRKVWCEIPTHDLDWIKTENEALIEGIK